MLSPSPPPPPLPFSLSARLRCPSQAVLLLLSAAVARSQSEGEEAVCARSAMAWQSGSRAAPRRGHRRALHPPLQPPHSCVLRAVLAPKRRPRIEASFSGVDEVEEPLMSWIYLQSSPAVVGPGAAFLWELSLGSAEIREWPPLPSLHRSL